MNCFIIDDEQFAITVLENYIKQIPALNLIGSTTNPVKGLDFIKNNNIELLFLDIQMDMLNGIELMKQVPENTKVIFCTAYSEFAVSGFELEAIDYLMKPIEFLRFEKSVKRAQNIIKGTTSKGSAEGIPFDYIFVKTDHKGKYLKIFYDDILYIESKKNYIEFNLAKEKHLVYGSLQNLESQLLSNQFIRVHKSFIVSINKIKMIENNMIHFHQTKDIVPVSTSYRAEFLQRISDKLLKT